MGLAALCFCGDGYARKLVILHTNDTHSAIEPMRDGTGGVLQRKAVFDSIRAKEKNVIAIDAGDIVQGSLYFKYFRGDVEYPLMDMLGYDIRILGNHEFDNGMADLAKKYKGAKGDKLSANYDFSGTEMDGVMKPYVIKKIDGKRIGFIGINIQPEGLISHKNVSLKFMDPIETANEMASFLKKDKKCDIVVVVSHIGYNMSKGKPSDLELAKRSRDIDLIIGGHSHTLVNPSTPDKTPSLVANAEDRLVRVVQSGKNGRYVGKLCIDLDSLKNFDGSKIQYELIEVTDRFPAKKLNQEMIDFIAPYKKGVDSVNNRVIGRVLFDMPNARRVGPIANLTADVGYEYVIHKLDSLKAAGRDVPQVDFAIMNVGGIRQPISEGNLTEGQVLAAYPFSNRYVAIELSGADVIAALKVAASKGGEAVSRNMRVLTDANGNLTDVVIDGVPLDPDKRYVVATIDYLAEGNDDLTSLSNHIKIWIDEDEVSVPILRWFERQGELGLPIAPDPVSRFQKEVVLQ